MRPGQADRGGSGTDVQEVNVMKQIRLHTFVKTVQKTAGKTFPIVLLLKNELGHAPFAHAKADFLEITADLVHLIETGENQLYEFVYAGQVSD